MEQDLQKPGELALAGEAPAVQDSVDLVPDGGAIHGLGELQTNQEGTRIEATVRSVLKIAANYCIAVGFVKGLLQGIPHLPKQGNMGHPRTKIPTQGQKKALNGAPDRGKRGLVADIGFR